MISSRRALLIFETSNRKAKYFKKCLDAFEDRYPLVFRKKKQKCIIFETDISKNAFDKNLKEQNYPMDKLRIQLNFENVFNLRENFVFIVYYLFLNDVNVLF